MCIETEINSFFGKRTADKADEMRLIWNKKTTFCHLQTSHSKQHCPCWPFSITNSVIIIVNPGFGIWTGIFTITDWFSIIWISDYNRFPTVSHLPVQVIRFSIIMLTFRSRFAMKIGRSSSSVCLFICASNTKCFQNSRIKCKMVFLSKKNCFHLLSPHAARTNKNHNFNMNSTTYD